MARTSRPPRPMRAASSDICGLYFVTAGQWGVKRIYLPQVSVHTHTKINTCFYETILTQTFINPQDSVQPQATYAFPLYDGVVATHFKCTIGDRTIWGKVKEKQEARKTFDAAVSRGESAGLLESLPAGIFSVSVGNIPAKSNVKVEISYGGELKHDAEMDGLRYTLPVAIAPRYGSYPGEVLELDQSNVKERGMRIDIDLDLDRLHVESISTPIDTFKPLMESIIHNSKTVPTPHPSARVSVTLTEAEMSEDFVLLIEAPGIQAPQAISHTTVGGTQTVMATFVPKFKLPNAKPEIVFVADQSGSMAGSKNESLKSALTVFLKSLPKDIHFNVCAFGSRYEFVFDESQPYTKETAKKALDFVQTFQAHYGGTEMQQPVEKLFEKRLGRMPLEAILLTDGEIWQEQNLFNFVNDQVSSKGVDARVFCLGIGSDVSHTLVEGIARAGRGLAQFVTENETLDQKVIRMLKTALYPHLRDVRINLEGVAEDEDGFEVVEQQEDEDVSMAGTDAGAGSTSTTTQEDASSVSLFDEKANLDANIPDSDADVLSRIPDLIAPDSFVAPFGQIPLFPFNRTTVYHHSPQSDVKPRTLVLTAKAPQGDISLKIPISYGTEQSRTVNALAARKVIQDLEEGRGYLAEHKPRGFMQRLKDIFTTSDQYEKLAKKAIVELGVRHGIASKYTSFVAVEASSDNNDESQEVEQPSGELPMHPSPRASTGGMAPRKQLASKAARRSAPSSSAVPLGGYGGALQSMAVPPPPPAPAPMAACLPGGPPGTAQDSAQYDAADLGIDCAMEQYEEEDEDDEDIFAGDTTPIVQDSVAPGGQAPSTQQATPRKRKARGGLFGAPAASAQGPPLFGGAPTPVKRFRTDIEVVRDLIVEQDFDGSWNLSKEVIEILGLNDEHLKTEGLSSDKGATVLVLVLLREKYSEFEEVWELCAEKAEAWKDESMQVEEASKLLQAARSVLGLA